GRNSLELIAALFAKAAHTLPVRAREIQIPRPRQPVGESELEFLAEIPRRENAVGLVSPVGEPLFEFAAALGQHLRFLHVSEQAFVRASGGGQQRDGCEQAANATAVERADRCLHSVRFTTQRSNRVDSLLRTSLNTSLLERAGLGCKHYFPQRDKPQLRQPTVFKIRQSAFRKGYGANGSNCHWKLFNPASAEPVPTGSTNPSEIRLCPAGKRRLTTICP